MAITGPFYWNKTDGTFPSQGDVPMLIGEDAFDECCCGDARICQCCSGDVPASLSVFFSGIEDGAKPCECYNGTYIVNYYSECLWRYVFQLETPVTVTIPGSGTIITLTQLKVSVSYGGPNCQISAFMTLTDANGLNPYSIAQGWHIGESDCANWCETMSTVQSGVLCNRFDTTITITVTAL